MKKALYLVLTVFLATSCVSSKKMIYMQDVEEELGMFPREMFSNPVIRPNDILLIHVSTDDVEVAQPYNLVMPARTPQEAANPTMRQSMGYIVDNDGTIQFPILGALKVGGLTRQQLIDVLEREISRDIRNPIINVRIVNYKVTVMGEVARPGAYPVDDERVTLLEALGMAGDLTVYGRRDNIMVIREEEGVKTYNFIDLTQSDFLHSPYYYLQQNDVVYVQPNRAQIQSSAYNRNTSIYISVASVLVSLAVLLSRL